MFYLTYAPGPPIREFVDYAQIGLPPKLFSRVLRDQSHLINDFQEFSGFSPLEYLRRHQPDGRLKIHHVPIPR